MRRVLLKLNVPFCLHSCPFCTRPVLTGWDSARSHAYLQALQAELAANAEQFSDCRIEAVRWGGGTASMANGEDIAETMRLLRTTYAVAEDCAVTMRAAICNFSGASMPWFKRAGIQRFDLEMLSLEPLSFGTLNKTDALGDFPVVCDHFLRSARNNNLGVVLLYGHTEVSRASFRRSVLMAMRSHAVHVRLQCCEGKDYGGDESAAEAVAEAGELLAAEGYHEYLPQQFARPGYEDRYLQGLASDGEVLGFGLGARTRFEGVCSTNTTDLATYLAHSGDYTQITASVEPLGS
jgi:oxygen-independent coproporphyrinogen-3 oxidase